MLNKNSQTSSRLTLDPAAGKAVHTQQRPRTGLVLEGGAMRGMYTAAVLDLLMKENIQVDGIIGVSAGALFGVNYLSKQPGRAIRYCKKYNKDPQYCGLIPLIREGNIMSSEYCFDRVPKKLDAFDNETYKVSDVPFYAVMTDTETGFPVYAQIHDVFKQMDYLRASGSMPIVSKPVQIGDKTYLDGGISDSIPYKWMARHGYDRLIVVRTRDTGYVKKPVSKTALRLLLRDMPAIADAMANRHVRYNQSVSELDAWQKSGKVFVIQPSKPIHIQKLEKDPEKIDEVYQLGVKDMEKALPSLKAFLDQQSI